MISKFDISAKTFRIGISLFVVLAAATRAPSLFLDLPPYMFCDEEALFYADVIEMLRSDSASSSMFRSGPMNVYPIWIIARVIEIFSPITDLQVLFIGRIILPFGLGAFAVIPLALFLKYLTGLRYLGLIASALYVSSSFLTATSRYWYPDHYMFFFASLVAMYSARLILVKRAEVTALLLGLAFSMMISVKYHSAVLLVMVIVAFWQRYVYFPNSREEKTKTIHNLFVFAGSAITFTALLHLNTLANFDSLIEQQLLNVNNYSQVAPDPLEGTAAYAFTALILMVGPLGFLAAGFGTGALIANRQFLTLMFLSLAPLALILILGSQGLFVNRNVVPAGPLLIALASIGAVSMARWARPIRHSFISYLKFGLVSLVIIGQVVLAAYSFAQDLRPDSRVLAQAWIERNIPTNTKIGTNPFCFGISAAEAAERETLIDAGMEQQLEYYVFDSYSSSSIVTNFRTENASVAFLEPKYFHYYFFGDRELFTAIVGLVIDRPTVVPEGYSLVARFEQNGPAVWVLRRD